MFLAMLMTFLGCSGNRPSGAFGYYEYRYTTMGEYPREYYRLEYNADHVLTLTWAKDCSDYTVLRVPEDAVQELTGLICKHKLYRLKDSYQPLFDIRDGDMWHVYYSYEKGYVGCSAYHSRPPKALWAGVQAVNAYFSSLIEALSEDDILEVRKNTESQ